MISPTSITNFDRSTRELQVFWLFSIFVAGKNSDIASRKLSQLTGLMPDEMHPFDWFRVNSIRDALEKCKVGQYNRIGKAIQQSLDLDLKTATLSQLMEVHGVGPKTARFYLLHSRKDCKHAVLDVHILNWIRSQGLYAPTQTPQKTETYDEFERIFYRLANEHFPNIPLANVDLHLWTEMSGRS